MQKTITFRSQAMGVVVDLAGDEGMTCLPSRDLIFQIAGELLNYREEGVELNPTILFCEDIKRVALAFPGSTTYIIGKAKLSGQSAKKILKNCAPLATENWHIFVERKDSNNIEYGIFRYLIRPTTLPLYENIFLISDQIGVVIRKTSRSSIDLHGSKGGALTIVFSTARDDSPPSQGVEKFCEDCCAGLTALPEIKEFKLYLRQLLERAITASHGTILFCAKPEDIASIEALGDCVLIAPRISLVDPFVEYKKSDSSDSLINLRCAEEIIQGFMNSDGMVAFDPEGGIFAYRVFYRGDEEIPEVDGGARRRAFEGFRTLVGTAVTSALFRSQDGLMIYAGGRK